MRSARILIALKRAIPTATQALVLGGLIVTAYVAYNAGTRHGGGHQDQMEARPGTSAASQAESADIIYTCSMHPQIRQSEPGDCPICGMELVPTSEVDPASDATSAHGHAGHDDTAAEVLGYACAMNCLPPLEEDGPCPICGMEMQPVHEDDGGSEADPSPRRMTMSSQAVALANVETATVGRGPATREVRLVGQTVEDPRRRSHVSANIGGRIDVLHAEFVGDIVQAGQPLAEIYSPELLAVQEELLQAVQSAGRLGDAASPSMGRSGAAAIEAMRQRLVLAGLTEAQVDEIIEHGSARERVMLNAPAGGTVTARFAEQGEYVGREERILTLVDYGVLWAELEAFESDLPWLAPGQQVAFTSRSFPGRTFHGTVSWIDPVADPATRTTRVRMDVDNPDGHLRPGMYVSANVSAALEEDPPPLIIPASAPLITGRRAIVYTMREDAERPTFDGREVVLGPRVREGYVVREGLAEGERVVTRGAFQIDSALQIIARPSMMSPEGGQVMDGHAGHGTPDAATPEEDHATHREPAEPTALRDEELVVLLPHYLLIHEALADDDEESARAGWAALASEADALPHGALHGLLPPERGLDGIDAIRTAFEPLSNAAIAALNQYGNPAENTLYIMHCPMAFDWEGADWIQTGDDVRNPYFGDEMYRCGTVEAEATPR